MASIGSTEITGDQFRQTFTDRLQQLSRQAGRPITPAQAVAVGFDQQLLGQLVAEAALDENTRALGLNVSSADVAKRIAADPVFRGITGDFDRSRFEQLIRQGGFTEQRYIADQEKVLLRRQLADALSRGVAAPVTANPGLFPLSGRTAQC